MEEVSHARGKVADLLSGHTIFKNSVYKELKKPVAEFFSSPITMDQLGIKMN